MPVVRPCLLEMTRAIHDTSTMWLTKQDLNKDTTNRHAVKEGGHLMSLPSRELQEIQEC